jgi:hypothetical protein
MSRSKRAGKALVAGKALAVLARLASDGAYAAAAGPLDGTADTFAVYAPSNGFAEPVCVASRLAIAHGLRKGWVAPDESGVRLRISAAGLRALRARAETGSAAPCAHGEAGSSARVAAEGALAWLRNRKDKDGRPLITEVQFNAGEKLAGDFWQAQLSPRVTANWSAVTPGRRLRRATPGFGVDMRDAVVAARQRFQRALEAVGPELAGILVDVCCHDVGLEVSGHAAGWPRRAAKVVLELALTRLARHYGMIAPEPPLASRLRHWGDADFRPTLEAWR